MQITNFKKTEDRLVTAKDAAVFLTISRASFYRMVKDGRLPKPRYPLSKHMPRWLISDLVAALDIQNGQ